MMSASISRNCPHCGTNNCHFLLISWYSRRSRSDELFNSYYDLFTIFKCNNSNCTKPLMVHFADVPQSALPDIEGDFNGNMDHLSSWVQQEWPATKPVAPQYTPSPIVNDFEEAFDNLQRQNWNSAGMALRRTLEMTVNHVGKDQIGEDEWKPLRRKSLEKRIDALGQHGLLSPALLEWAHELRESLNKATHEEDPYTEQEAREMGDIAELMLTYLFTLPVRLKNRREQRELEKQQAASELDFDDEIPF